MNNKSIAMIRWRRTASLGLLSLSAALGIGMIPLTAPQNVGPVHAAALAVGLITDETGLNDRAWNWTSYQGLLQAESLFGVVGTVYTSTSSADYGPNLQNCVNDGNSLCISVGLLMADDTWSAAQANPGVDFAIIDFAGEASYPSNLRGTDFAVNEPAYLAGTLAGLMTQSDTVGAIGGFSIPVVDTYIAGFRNGAQRANLDAQVLVEYTFSFSDSAAGEQAAMNLIAQGADVIFGAAGQAGSGGIRYAAQQEVWVIGVDFDEYDTTFGGGTVPGSNRILTSAIKELDVAVCNTIEDRVNGAFTSGTVLYDLARLGNACISPSSGLAPRIAASGHTHSQQAVGIGLAPFHEADPLVPQVVKTSLDEVRQGIMGGSIDVSLSGRTYLPLTLKVVGP